jgi:signal transduction histidine kinase
LEPVEPVPEGLMAALRRLAGSTQSLFQVTCWCQMREPILVADHRVATDVFRIAQEAVSNAIKHGKAQTIRLHLARSEGRLILTVRSNGKPKAFTPIGRSGRARWAM